MNWLFDAFSFVLGTASDVPTVGRTNLEMGDITVAWNDAKYLDAAVCFAMENYVPTDGVRTHSLTQVWM